jgi:hypothetical protein
MREPKEVTYQIDFGSPRSRQRQAQRSASSAADLSDCAPADSIPRIARLMALAIRLAALIKEGSIQDYAEVARVGGVTRARVTQIARLLDLAPDLQEKLLFGQFARSMNERNLRPIVGRIDWDEQRRMFEKVAGTRVADSARNGGKA